MFRVNSPSRGRWYAKEIESVEAAAEDIQLLAETGDPVIVVEDLADLDALGIMEDDVEVL